MGGEDPVPDAVLRAGPVRSTTQAYEIGTPAAHEAIVSAATFEQVGSAAPEDIVGSSLTQETIISTIAFDHIS